MDESKNLAVDISLQRAIEGSRSVGSFIGSLTGKAFYKAEDRNTWPGGDDGWNKDIESIRAGITKSIMPSRKINKFSLREINIFNAGYVKRDIINDFGIGINVRPDNTYDHFFPLDTELYKVAKSTPDAIEAALRGEGDNFFLNPKAVAAVMNDANKAEINNIDALIKKLQNAKQALLSAISENNRKADKFVKELKESEVDGVDFKSLANNSDVTLIAEVKDPNAE